MDVLPLVLLTGPLAIFVGWTIFQRWQDRRLEAAAAVALPPPGDPGL
ncbi:hypothetical protein [Phenylobacterium sp.]